MIAIAFYNGTYVKICPRCWEETSTVIDVRNRNEVLQRRRKCTKCGYRWTTVEIDIFTYEQKIKGDVEEDEYEE